MTWRTFADAIHASKITDDVPWRIINDMFVEAGYAEGLVEPTVRSWLNEKRKCDGRRYFPNKKIDNKRVFAFFKNRSEEKLRNLQNIFQKTANADSPIDVKTDNIGVFCWSLVNQFLDLLGFQRVDIPHIDTPSLTASVEASQLFNRQGVDISGDIAPTQAQEALCSLPSIGGADVPVAKMRSIRSMILPHSDDCCYHCAYWVGDRQTYGAYTTARYGVCTMYHRPEQLSSDLPCKDYKKRQKLLGDW